MSLPILYVEDDSLDILIMRRELKRLDPAIQLETVASAEAAVARLEEIDPPGFNAFIVDLNMPGRGGIMLLRMLKDDERFCQIPRIVFSSSDLLRDRECADIEGADAYVVKTTNRSIYKDLIETIELVNSTKITNQH